MPEAAKLGHNRTGAQMSPEDTQQMMEAVEQYPPTVAGDDTRLAREREAMTDASEGVGTVPVPGSTKGKLKSGFDKMLGKQPELLVDKLGERLAFERTGVRLYDAVIAKLEVSDSAGKKMIPELKHIRDEEAEHMFLIKDAIETLGADPTAMTPCADIAGVMAQGPMQVVTDPRTNASQALNALLTLELTDNAAWESLIELTDKAGHPNIAKRFRKAVKQEEEHLQTIKRLLNNELASHM